MKGYDAMNMPDIIIKKRNGNVLSKDDIIFFVSGVTNGTIPDYQTSALLMAIYFSGMDSKETAYLSEAMADSGEKLDISCIEGIKVDKHSTGGVGDSTTLIAAPLAASLGIPVIKMSGRGLGFSGGTIDKLTSIPNYNVNIDIDTAISLVNKNNIALFGQTSDIAPADKKLYALRDVTGTVESLPLIASSIMSKKIAAGADKIVLDIKYGSGAFMKDIKSARALADEMAAIGKIMNKEVDFIISSMEQPLGKCIGNSIEIIEVIETLKGRPMNDDLLEVSLAVGAKMVVAAGKAETDIAAKAMLKENIYNGKGINKFKELIEGQGGNSRVIDDYSLFPKAKYELKLKAEASGYIYSINTELIGKASVQTGAGRVEKDDDIDYSAGIFINVRIGDQVKKGDFIAKIFSSDESKLECAKDMISEAIDIRDSRPIPPKLIAYS